MSCECLYSVDRRVELPLQWRSPVLHVRLCGAARGVPVPRLPAGALLRRGDENHQRRGDFRGEHARVRYVPRGDLHAA